MSSQIKLNLKNFLKLSVDIKSEVVIMALHFAARLR